MPKVLPITIFVALKAGTYRGKAIVEVTPTAPSGKRLNTMTVTGLFDGEERGVNVVVTALLGLEDEGPTRPINQ